jgi:hypothetical protein
MHVLIRMTPIPENHKLFSTEIDIAHVTSLIIILILGQRADKCKCSQTNPRPARFKS